MKKYDQGEGLAAAFAQEKYTKHMQVWMKFLLELQYRIVFL